MWRGLVQQLDKITIKDVPLLSTVATVIDSARDLGVITDVDGRACYRCLP